MKAVAVNRRQFLRYSAFAGGLALSVGMGGPNRARAEGTDPAWGRQAGPFVLIKPDNNIEISFPNPEMGQGVDTSLPMLLAEELGADFERVSVRQMPLAIAENGEGGYQWKYVGQGSGGSNSISGHWEALRQAGATARLLLLKAAAREMGVPLEELRAAASQVEHLSSGQALPFGQLAATAATLEPPVEPPALKSREEFTLIGTPQKMKAAHAIVTGKAVYGIDAEIPGMVHAVVERAPMFDSKVESIDDRDARRVPGVIDVIKLDGPADGEPYHILAEGVAVVADTLWAAIKARKLLQIVWTESPFANESSESFREHCQDLLKGEGQIVRSDGDLKAAFEAAAEVHEAHYWQPYVSHAPMEPQNCIADVRDDGVDIVGPMQMPSGPNRAVARALGIEDRLSISVTPTRLGGGFGRRLTSDYAVEAALISKAVKRPVKVQWMREDDMRHDFYRPAGMHHLRAAFDADGALIGWAHRLASASKYYRRPNLPESDYHKAELYTDDFPAHLVPNLQVEYFSAQSGAPRGSWRAPAHTANAFVVQSFLDEIALRRNEDPLVLRLRLLGEPRELSYEQHGGPVFNPGRLAGVLKMAAEQGGYGEALGPGEGRGIAAHFTFGGYVAQVVDVKVDSGGRVKVKRVVAAVDIGQVVNPSGVEAQLEGGVNDGLSTALRLAIDIQAGGVQTSNFDDYRLMPIADSPPHIETHIIDNGESPAGMGEMGLPPLAPALANAIQRATGKRIRDLPIADQLS